MNGLRTIVAVLGFALCGATAAQGTWPAKPIHMIVPFPPGSSPDLVARMINERLAAALGQPVVIENKPGAGGMVGTGQVAKAAPDGYTLGVSIPGPLAVNTVLMKNMEYDPFRELAPVTVVAASPNVLVVDAKLGASTLREFIALAKTQPGKLNFGSVGNGSASHLTMELLKQRAGIDLVQRYGFLGGMGTAAGVTNFCGLHANVHGDIRQVVHGVADDLLSRIPPHWAA